MSIMKWNDFPFIGHQVGEHDDFRQHMKDCHRRILDGELVISQEITNYLKSWLIDHILATDKRFCQFLAAQGVS